ncbi:heme exporter protein CcmD [Hyphomicrobium sp.]|jgi:heme exporter protein D|uniref:heme exporter protein CcmD n=1 Tax=Hyphomicrobium sp. TaxID=82 RepID=UPI002B65E356|nr:heme exporter protein CcmD [Hyphomicrobium sp.]HVZ04898.1 heme exporter protein CcmD [Hyphomicrobium sp.]
MNLGPHAAFIWISYAAVAIVVAGLIVWLIVDGRRQAAALEALGKRGIRRRSAAGVE